MNIPLLLEIADRIAKKPELFLMQEFQTETACGTACCIAGWALKLSGAKISPAGFSKIASEALGISNVQSHRLFCYAEWPEQFLNFGLTWPINEHTPEFAENAVRRIHWFIQTGGRE